jgi:L-gulono-1,4-lactone dehydrogenase
VRRATWHNHTGNQWCQPLLMCVPETVDDVVGLVREAQRERVGVRAVGSGHSWSDVALTGGFLLGHDRLVRQRSIGWANSGIQSSPGPFVRVAFQSAAYVSCSPTSSTGVGADCSIATTANALIPDAVQTGNRAIWQLGQVQVTDGGEDGVASSTTDNSLFMKQGVFVR